MDIFKAGNIVTPTNHQAGAMLLLILSKDGKSLRAKWIDAAANNSRYSSEFELKFKKDFKLYSDIFCEDFERL